ncbi:MAG TPA: D-alanyl-D-alanine carboxypeptidase [Candidatus Faecimonas intestinavium]|nr:D-alanyl-D-alanine carboxypeptidase [Candidatus Faecimonas intestinavium]
MTAILAIENGDLDKKVVVGEEVLSMYGTNIYVEVGEKMTMRDLIYGLLLRSGNDAAVVIAKEIGGTEAKFVQMMNSKAREIGMKNTVFKNPHGLDEVTENYSTAYDMALLSKYAFSNKIYRKIVATKKYEVSTGKKTYLWYNRNRLLDNYKYCTGGKNGYTPSAGKTLVSTASKGNLNLTIVSLNDGDSYSNHQNLYENMFSKYHRYKIVDKDSFVVSKEFSHKNVYLKKSFYYPLTDSEINDIRTVVHFFDSSSSDKVGVVDIYLNNQKIGNLSIYEQEKKKEQFSFFRWIKNLIG